MNQLDDIRNSGLLELYVLGQLDSKDQAIVESALKQYPELRTDLREIEQGLYNYAAAHKVDPAPSVKTALMKSIKGSDEIAVSQKSNLSKYLWPLLAGLLAILSAYVFSLKNVAERQLKEAQACCATLDSARANQIAIYNDLADENNQIVQIAATEKYPNTKLVIHSNSVTGKNYLQIDQLPELGDNQSFQLWALKGNDPPIPLDVFDLELNRLSPVSFVEASQAYAITIEPKGGKDTPTMENLIGVFTI